MTALRFVPSAPSPKAKPAWNSIPCARSIAKQASAIVFQAKVPLKRRASCQ